LQVTLLNIMVTNYRNSVVGLFIFLSAFGAEGNVWTVDLGLLTTQRLDAIVFPNESPEGHVHSVAGASRFSKNCNYDELLQSRCTSANVKKDLSNYWVPTLYTKKPNGKFYSVDMYFAVYYKLINARGQTDFYNNPIIPGEFNSFPPGFRMLIGSPYKGDASNFISYNCLYSPTPHDRTSNFPPWAHECELLRGEVTFPCCWNGDLDSSDHTSHMAYPYGPEDPYRPGECPPSHPHRVPTVFYEAIYNTGDIVEPGDELVYSFGDYSGYGFHADFVNGWQEGIIDQLVDFCTYNDAGLPENYQCNVEGIADKRGGPDGSCDWEGTDDENQYLGELDNLPPCGKSCL